MSKMSELAALLVELRHCGEVLIGISDTWKELFSAGDSEAVQLEVNTPEAQPQPEQVKAETPDEPKPLTLEEVRPILAKKSRAGHSAAIRELLKKHGSPNLSGIDPAEYPALLEEVEAL